MKKTYKNPKINVVKVEAPQMMAGSLKYDKTTNETSGNFSKGGGFWSDDDEDEYED